MTTSQILSYGMAVVVGFASWTLIVFTAGFFLAWFKISHHQPNGTVTPPFKAPSDFYDEPETDTPIQRGHDL